MYVFLDVNYGLKTLILLFNLLLVRSHRNLKTHIQIPARHMRFVLDHKQIDGDTASLPPAKWLVELVLISIEEGKTQFISMNRIN